MWKRLLNSTVLATTTHRRLERVSDWISTQVVVQIINKCRINIDQRGLYNGGDPPWTGDRKSQEKHYGNQEPTL